MAGRFGSTGEAAEAVYDDTINRKSLKKSAEISGGHVGTEGGRGFLLELRLDSMRRKMMMLTQRRE